MIPLRDANPTSRRAWVTLMLIAANVAVFLLWEPVGGSAREQSIFFVCHGAIPDEMTDLQPIPEVDALCGGKSVLVSILTSMFIHGGILHIAGNMLFLWVFGNNIEDSMGRVKFALFYLLAGLIAVYSQALIDPGSTAPTIGASGAVAGVLGAYALLHPRARILTLIFIIFFVTLVEIPALILLAVWFVLQFIPALGQVAVESGGDQGIAYFAHVGGFLFGLAAIKLFATRRREPEPRLPVY